MNGLTIAALWLQRGLKKGDWLWLWIAVLLASLTVTLVTLLSSTVEQSMLRQAATTLGADAELRSTRPIEAKWRQKAKQLGLETSQTVSLVTMLPTESGDFQLVSLKAVDKAYPLRGEGFVRPIENAWLKLEHRLALKFPTVQQVQVGKLSLSLQTSYQPKILQGMSALAPEALMPLALLEETGLLGPGSRVSYQLSIKAEVHQANALKSWLADLEAENNPAWQIISAKAPNEDLQTALQRAQDFLQLAALSAVIVSGLAILIASRFYLQQWQNQIGLLRALGATQRQIRNLFAWQLSLLAWLASGLGVLLGFGFFWLVQPWLHDFFDEVVLGSTGSALGLGIVAGTLVLWSFAWPAYRQVVALQPMQILRAWRPAGQTLDLVLGGLGLSILIAFMLGFERWFVVLGGLILVGLSFYMAAWLLLRGLQRMQGHAKGWFKIALSSVTRNPAHFQLQVIAFGLVLFVLMAMTLVRGNLLAQWQASLDKDTPNTFIMNVQPDQASVVKTIFDQAQLKPNLVAMARGRLVAVNDQALLVEEQTSNRARRLLAREANIALMPEVPEHNFIDQGTRDLQQGVSVEIGIAQTFGIQLGDRLTFDFLGHQVTLPVTSFRGVVWQSFQLNFFFILPDSYKTQLPYSYIGNVHLTSDSQDSLNLSQQINDQAPGVLVIEVGPIMAQLQDIMNQASWAVTLLYAFTLLASFVVLLAAILASQQGRLQSWLLLKTLGLQHSRVVKIGLTEFLLLGAVAGVIAASFAQLASGLMSVYLFKFEWQWQGDIWFMSLVLGMSTLVLLAAITQSPYLKLSPLALKRKL